MSSSTPTDQHPPVPDPSPPADERPHHDLGLNVAQIMGSALAAVTAAVGASFFGVGGTIVGAVFGSVVSTIAGALYVHSLKTAGTRIREVAPAQLLTGPHVVRGARRSPPGGPVPDPNVTPSPGDVPPTDPPTPADPSSRRPGWKVLAGLAAAGFLIALAVISGYELIAGHPISAKDGSGSTIGDIVQGRSGNEDSTPEPTSTSTSTSTADSTEGATADPEESATSTPTTTTTVTVTEEPTTSSSSSTSSSAPTTSSSAAGAAPAPKATTVPEAG